MGERPPVLASDRLGLDGIEVLTLLRDWAQNVGAKR